MHRPWHCRLRRTLSLSAAPPTRHSQTSSSIACAPSSCWSMRDRSSASQFRIMAQRLGSNGLPIGTATVVVNTPKQHRRPRVAINRSSGEYMVVWYDDDANKGVFGQLLSPSAEPVGNMIVIAPPSHGEQTADLAYSSSPSHFLTTWIDYRHLVGSDVFAQRLSTSGQPLGQILPYRWQRNRNTLRPSCTMTSAASSS
jgi:hypothetical protein